MVDLNKIDLNDPLGRDQEDKSKEKTNEEKPESILDQINQLTTKMKEIIEKEKQYKLNQLKETTQEYLDIKQKLIEFPEKVQTMKETISVLKDKAEEAEEELDLIESTLFLQVNQAKDKSGKNKYSNKAAREARLKELKQKDSEFIEAKEDLKDTKKELEQAEFELDRAYNEYKSAKRLAGMVEARINLLAGINRH